MSSAKVQFESPVAGAHVPSSTETSTTRGSPSGSVAVPVISIVPEIVKPFTGAMIVTTGAEPTTGISMRTMTASTWPPL
ncbi:MAG TPA: hypothetical protein EYP43_04620 [Thermoplasmata archaeon]|nr:hypothetical protein [Thermoplasmata archaeon]